MKLGSLSSETSDTVPAVPKESTWFTIGDAEYDRLNPPVCKVIFDVDGVYVQQIDDEKWLPVGHIPMPRTRAGWFVYHFVHGLFMRYRLLPVLIYSIQHSFMDGGADNVDR